MGISTDTALVGRLQEKDMIGLQPLVTMLIWGQQAYVPIYNIPEGDLKIVHRVVNTGLIPEVTLFGGVKMFLLVQVLILHRAPCSVV